MSKEDNNKLEEISNSEDFNLSIFFKNIKRNKLIIASFTSITFLLSIIYLILKSPVYEGKFQIVLSEAKKTSKNPLDAARQSLLFNNPQLGNIFGSFAGGSLEILTEVEILRSPSILLPVFNRVKEQKLSKGIDVSEWEFLGWRKNFLTIERENKTSILNITYIDKDKKFILDVLNDISNTYQKYSTNDRTKHIKQGLKFLDEQINIYKNEFVNSNKKVLTFALENDLPTSNFEERRGLKIEGNKENFKNGLSNVANQKRALKDMLTYFKSIKDNDEKLLTFSKIVPNEYSDRIYALDTSLALLKINYRDSDIEITKNRLERKTYINLLKNYLESYLEKEIKNNEFKYNAAIRPKEILIKYNELKSQAKRDNTTLTSLETEKRLLSLEKAKADNPWELITKPTIKNKPVKPDKPKVLILGIFGGFFFGYIFAFIQDLKSSKIFIKEEMRKLLNSKELIWLSNKKSSIWKELLNVCLSNLKDFSQEEDISLIKLGNIDQEKLKIIKEILEEKSPNINIYDSVIECKKSNNLFLISQLARTTKKDIANYNEEKFLLNLENINWILIDD